MRHKISKKQTMTVVNEPKYITGVTEEEFVNMKNEALRLWQENKNLKDRLTVADSVSLKKNTAVREMKKYRDLYFAMTLVIENYRNAMNVYGAEYDDKL